MKLLVAVTLLLAACSSAPSREEQAQRDAARAARAEAEAKQAKCDADPKCDVERKRKEAEELHKVNYPVVNEFSAKEYRKKFETALCNSGGKPMKSLPADQQKKCRKKFEDTFIAKLAENYPMAPPEKIESWCKANPMDCRDWDKLEDQFRDLHQGMSSMMRAERETEEIRQKRERARAEMEFQSVEAALGQGRHGVTCTTWQYGNTSVQSCD